MKTIEGNLLSYTSGILCHQVNLRGVMGAGLALQIRRKWPSAYEEYVYHCQKGAKLGDVLFSEVDLGLSIAHLFGQRNEMVNGTVTDYSVYPRMLVKVKDKAQKEQIEIFIPHGIGCGIAGGTWGLMEHVIRTECPETTLVNL